MGVLASGICYSEVSAALDGLYGGLGPAILDYSGSPALSYAERIEGNWYMATAQAGVVVARHPLPTPSFAACDPAQAFADGAQLALAISIVWVVAWGSLSLRRVAR